MIRFIAYILFCLFGLLAMSAQAQQTSVAFGTLKTDTTQPVEVSSDSLSVDQAQGTVTLQGNVLIIQGEMRLSANDVLIRNRPDGSGIESLLASGNVILVSGEDAAKSETAEYTILTGVVDMDGNVVLTQGPTTLSSQRMSVNLTTGNATLSGRVRTTLNPGKN